MIQVFAGMFLVGLFGYLTVRLWQGFSAVLVEMQDKR